MNASGDNQQTEQESPQVLQALPPLPNTKMRRMMTQMMLMLMLPRFNPHIRDTLLIKFLKNTA
jgi:hypothetical protein